MLHWWRITSAGDITMSAVLNIRDDTFMCEAIKSDEARLGGIGRIYRLCLSLTLFPLTSFHHLSLFVFLHRPTHFFILYIIALLVFQPRQETHSYPTLQNTAVSFLILLALPPSVSQSLYRSPGDHICVNLSCLSLHHAQSCLISVDLVVFNFSMPYGVSLMGFSICWLLF